MADDIPPGRKTDLFGQLDFIKTFIMDPCDAPWTAYALTMFGATVELFVKLWAWDYEQTYYDLLKEKYPGRRRRRDRKGLRGKKSTRLSRRLSWLRNILSDPSSQLGKDLGRALRIPPRPPSMVRGWLWAIYGILEAANFFFFLVDLVVGWFYRWMTLLWNSRYCQARDDCVIMKGETNWVGAAIFGETAVIVTNVIKIRGPISHSGSTVVLPPRYSGVVTCQLSARPEGNWPGQRITVRIRRMGATSPLDVYTLPLEPDVTTDISVAYEFNRPGTYTATYELSVGFCRVSNSTLYAQGTPMKKPPVA